MNMNKNNIILIGMPGAGKSTIGVILAKRLGYQFVDTDLIIQSQHNMKLQQLIDERGLTEFRRIEAATLSQLQLTKHVIATGGSAVYYPEAIAALGQTGNLIYLEVGLQELMRRIADMGARGLVMDKNQTFTGLYSERTPLYLQYADLSLPCDALSAEAIAAEIESRIIHPPENPD